MSLPTFGFNTTSDKVADALQSEIAGKNVLVTGTSINGIGFDTARSIAKYAGLVVITGYNAERLGLSAAAILKAVPTANIRTLVLDLSSLGSVRKAAAEINAYSEPLHVIIHNAADTSAVYAITADDIERQMAVAQVGPFLLTKLLLPKLLASGTPTWQPRIVMVASEAQGMGPGIDFTQLHKSGAYLDDCNEANDKLIAPAADTANADKLWKMTEEIIGEDRVLRVPFLNLFAVLVTGTSLNGIGFETARSIAKYAGLVVIAGYNADRLSFSAAAIMKEVPNANIRTLTLDLASFASIRKAAAEVNEYTEPLHVLIHNAVDSSGVYAITEDDIERQMAVAHFGPFLLTKLLIPKLLASASPTWLPRVVLVASQLHAFGPGLDFAHLRKPLPGSKQEQENFSRYHEVKVANVLFALGIAERGAGKLRAYSLHPGMIFTESYTKEGAIPGLQAMGVLTEDGKPAVNQPWKTLSQGAATTIVAAFDPRIDDKSGAYLVDGNEANNQRAACASDQANVDKLWKMSEEVIGEEFAL
uniref:Short-chain dehydrogenase/reductase family protein n=1 Tax=Mycena chlorophos TaxID=658473 RepID=A0ABQ0LND3_MYCCL|nr:predicted protein [Mycena chlorophos]